MRRNALENRERILVAAEEVFGAQGAAGSTDEVARRAQVGIATVFRHFPTKDELIEAALARHFAELRANTAALAGQHPPERALREVIDVMVRTGSTKLTLATLLSGSGAIPPTVIALSTELKADVAAVLRRAQRAGAVRRAVTIEEVYLLIRGVAQATATMPADPRTVQRAADVIWSGIATKP